MFDERRTVFETLTAMRRAAIPAQVSIVQSEDGEGSFAGATVLPNLARSCPRYEVAARALCRNFSSAFSGMTGVDSDYIVAMTGDTLVYDPTNFDRRYAEMVGRGLVAAVSQAIGQDFHAADADPARGKCGGRLQVEGVTTDIMPQFFILDGEFLRETNAFREIKVTNPYTSEQCLGDELVRALGDRPFHESVLMLNSGDRSNAYSYSDGIRYHARYK